MSKVDELKKLQEELKKAQNAEFVNLPLINEIKSLIMVKGLGLNYNDIYNQF